MARDPRHHVRLYYRALYRAWGPQHWWPGRTRFEVIVGAFLTQHTSWSNVELAMRRLRAAHRLTLKGIRQLPLPQLQQLIRPAGYFRQKARSLKNFVAFVDLEYGGSLTRMFAQSTEELRHQLLALKGVGPETADSILLYAGQHPVFVVDAYTRRIFERHHLVPPRANYVDIRQLAEQALRREGGKPSPHSRENRNRARETRGPQGKTRSPKAEIAFAHRPSPMSRAKRSAIAQAYNEMHGLLVQAGKHHCLKAKALCEHCPLQPFLEKA
jgi:endonuclease III related protein